MNVKQELLRALKVRKTDFGRGKRRSGRRGEGVRTVFPETKALRVRLGQI